MWHMTFDAWHVTHDMWYMTHDMWQMTCDRWLVKINFLSSKWQGGTTNRLNLVFLSTSVKNSFYRYFLENTVHTNLIPSNTYWAKLWCILLAQWSEGPWFSTYSTELKKSFPLYNPFFPFVIGSKMLEMWSGKFAKQWSF